jgi:triphosphoribosyl-dephospho-CoA synthetase
VTFRLPLLKKSLVLSAPLAQKFRDLVATAQLIVKRHGANAAIQAGMRADELLAEGDVDGAATWRAIIRAIKELQRAMPRQGEAMN